MNLETQPAAAVRARLQATAIRAHDALAVILLPPPRVLAQLTARLTEMAGQQRVHRKARNAQRGFGQGPHRGPGSAQIERPGASERRPCLIDIITQAEPRQDILSTATDEFAADAMSRIMPRLPDDDRNALLAEPAPRSEARR